MCQVQLHIRMSDETAQLQGEAIGRLGARLEKINWWGMDDLKICEKVIVSFI